MTDWRGTSFEVRLGPPGHGGFCVGRHEGRVVFVRHGLPGELVRVRVTEDRGGSFCRADAIEILEPSPDRVPATCPVSGPGGAGCCDFSYATPKAQRALKASVIAEQLRRLAGIDREVVVEPITGAGDTTTGWRTRIRLAVDAEGRAGVHGYRSTDVITDLRCPQPVPGALDGIADRLWTPGADLVIAVDGDGVRHIIELAPSPDRDRRGDREWLRAEPTDRRGRNHRARDRRGRTDRDDDHGRRTRAEGPGTRAGDDRTGTGRASDPRGGTERDNRRRPSGKPGTDHDGGRADRRRPGTDHGGSRDDENGRRTRAEGRGTRGGDDRTGTGGADDPRSGTERDNHRRPSGERGTDDAPGVTDRARRRPGEIGGVSRAGSGRGGTEQNGPRGSETERSYGMHLGQSGDDRRGTAPGGRGGDAGRRSADDRDGVRGRDKWRSDEHAGRPAGDDRDRPRSGDESRAGGERAEPRYDANGRLEAPQAGERRNASARRAATHAARDEWVIAGTGRAVEYVAGRRWEVSATGFWQAHHGAAQCYSDLIAEWSCLQPGALAWDLYSGAGVFAARLADQVGQTGAILAVESARPAVADGIAALRDLPWLDLHAQRVERWVAERVGGAAPDTIVLDPPRAGAGKEVIAAITTTGPLRIIHIGCDPAAFARDLGLYHSAGYHLTALRAFDAFPGTHHVECIALLEPTP
ncbi:TRAM domain-containing protein [Nocardia sp. NPDC057030]|uniref:TRAM domain-containing protein n=1 Tax=Nocardia sp. NPDC057030 TaxID=3346005 RepID=UPI00363A3F78